MLEGEKKSVSIETHNKRYNAPPTGPGPAASICGAKCSATEDVMLPGALPSNTCRHAVAKQRNPQSKFRAVMNIPETEQKHVEVECCFNFFNPPSAAANAYIYLQLKSTKGEVSSEAQRDSEQAMSATRAIYSFCAASIIFSRRIAFRLLFFFTIDCEAKHVNYKKRLLSLMLSPKSGDWYPTSAPGMLVLVSFLDFFCSPLKRLANSLVAVWVSEWCSI